MIKIIYSHQKKIFKIFDKLTLIFSVKGQKAIEIAKSLKENDLKLFE